MNSVSRLTTFVGSNIYGAGCPQPTTKPIYQVRDLLIHIIRIYLWKVGILGAQSLDPRKPGNRAKCYKIFRSIFWRKTPLS